MNYRAPPEKGNAARAGNPDGEDSKVDYKIYSKNSKRNDLVVQEDSILLRPIPVTFFPNDRAFTKRETEITLVDLAEKIEATTRESKRELPGVKLQRYGDRRTERRCLRNTENVLASHGLEIDHDPKDGPTTIDEAADLFREAGVAALLHSSASGRSDAWHALVPFSAEHTADERTAEVEKVNALFDGEIDQHASFTTAQHAYFGSVDGGPPMATILVAGRPIDTLDLPRLAKGRRSDGGHERDESGSGHLFRLAASMKAEGLGFLDFVIAAWEDEACLRHLEKEERVGRDRSTRAVERAWNRAPVPDVVSADDYDLLPPEAQPKSGLVFTTADDCATTSRREYVIKGLLARGDVAAIYGHPGVGKSLLGPFMGYGIALGVSLFGMRTKPGPVLYVAAEDPAGMQGRVAALRAELGSGADFTLVSGVGSLLPGSPDLKALMREVERRQPALVIIDTLALAFGGIDENSSQEMAKVISASRALADLGPAVALIHHSPKTGDGSPRGHSSLNGMLDVALELVKGDDGIVRAIARKNRNGSCDNLDIAFRIAVSPMGFDEDGDEIRFARCQPLDGPAPTAGPRATPAERAALAVLERVRWRTSDGVVRLEDWRAALLDDPGVSAAEKLEDRKRRARDVISSLSRKRLIVVREGRVFDPNVNPDDFDALDGSDLI